jgi:RHS repeat-associated protein
VSRISWLIEAIRLKAGSQGSALSRKAVWLAGLVFFGVLLLPAMASAAVCSDTWKGPAEGEWQTAEDWSLGTAPSSSDVACVGSGKTVDVTAGVNQAGVLLDEGTVVVSGGSLELASALEASSAVTLSVLGGSLITVGEVVVSGSFTGGGFATLKGAGSVVIASGAKGSVAAAGSAGLTLEEGTLRNEGTFTLGEKSGLQGSHKAQLVNTGTLILNGEGAGSGHALIAGTGEASLKNTGVVEKTEGSATTMQAEFAIDNEGKVSVTAGKLEFTEGGVSGELAVGSWSTSGAETEIIFNANGPTFALGATVPLSGAFEVANSTVTAGKIEGAAASVTISGAGLAGQGMLDVTGASASTLENLTTTDREGRAGGILEGPGEVDITGSLTGGGFGTLRGSGTTVIEPGATGAVVAGVDGLTLYERTLLNEGTFTIGAESGLQGIHKAELINTGTLIVNGEPEGTGHGLLAGMGEAKVLNLGLLEKTEGTGTTPIEFGYENFGTAVEETGKFKIFYSLSVEGSTQYGGMNESASGPEPQKCGEPVECATGDFYESQTDLAVGGRGVGLDLTRTYNSQAGAAGISGAFGHGWSMSFSDHLTVGEGKALLTQANGSTVPFVEGKGESFTPPAWSQDALSGNATAGYSVVRADQVKYQFEGSTGRLLSVTDRNGNQTKLGYGPKGLMETITDPAGRKITLAYNAEGLVESATDPLGHTVKYAYEEGTLAKVALPGEAKPRWQYHYDGFHEMTSMTDGRGGTVSNEYDESRRVTTQTDPAEHKLKFEYESFHAKITNNTTGSVTDEHFTSDDEPLSITRGFGTASATTTIFAYDAGNDLLSVTDGNNHKTKYTYDAAANRTSTVDPGEHETKWAYDGTHDVIATTTPNGEETKITRDSHGNAETVSRPAPGGLTQTTTYHYDPNGNLTSVVDPLKHTWSYEYDKQGDCTSQTDPEGDRRTFAYDEDSRMTSTVSPAGNVKGAEAAPYTTKVERDAQGRQLKIADPLGHIVKYVYDGDGNIETVTDANGHTTIYTYSGDNQTTKVKAPNGATTETGYDGAGHVTSQTDGNKHTTTYTRNVLGEVTEVKDPIGRIAKKEYDAAGNLKAVTDAAKRITKYIYDPANRLKEITYSEGKTPTVKYEYDADGNRIKMTDGTGKTSYTYDQLDRLTASTDGHGDSTGYAYDLASNQTKLTYPSGSLVTRAYDNAGRLQSVTDPSKNTTTFAYNPNSDLITTRFPKGTGEQDKIAYNTADQQVKITMTGTGLKVLAAIAYTRDGDGQLKTATATGLPGGSESASYVYDTNNRLEKAGSTTYAYDSADNPTTLGSNTSVYDNANQLKTSGATSYSYDQLGERVSSTPKGVQTTTFGYDQAGNLTQVKQSKAALNDTYTYDGNELRASQTKGKTTSYITWDMHDKLPLILSDGQGSYLYGPDNIPIEEIQSKGVILYLHHDQQDSTRMITSSTGTIEATTTYDAYGNAAGSTGTATTPLGYDGQYTNADTGLIYLRARSYDSATAQSLTVDPAGPITRSPYFYTNDNPLNFEDPSGLWSPIGALEEAANGVGHVIAQGSETVVHAGLNVAAVGPYALYYGSYELARGINSLGKQFGLPGEVISHLESLSLAQLQALGLAEDAGIDALKSFILGHESICDEGTVGFINPLHGFLPDPLQGPQVELPGIEPGGHIDIEW